MSASQEVATDSHSFSDLPADYIALLYEILPLQDLIQASRTCKHWNRCCRDVWESRCRSRWLHWSNPPACHSWKEWKHTYAKRHQVDCQILSLLSDACWPERQEFSHSRIMAAGSDALDILAAAAHSNDTSSKESQSAPFLGLAYQAHIALHFLKGALCADKLRKLLDSEHQQQQQQQGSSSAAAVNSTEAVAAGGQGLSRWAPVEGDALLQGALLMADVLHPLTDTAAVIDLIGQLGDELTRRIQTAGVHPRSKQAVELLNGLLFGPKAASAAASETADALNGLDNSEANVITLPQQLSHSSSSRRRCQRRCPWWCGCNDLDGADLSAIHVPTDGISGLGIQGNRIDYYHQDNSCLDSVLATGQGLPITLAVLHAEVGRRAGLHIVPVNLPGHVINRADVIEQDTAAATAAGISMARCADQAEEDNSVSSIYVDVFEGGQMFDEFGVRRLLAHSLYSLNPDIVHIPMNVVASRLSSMGVSTLIGRMLRNLVNSLCSTLGDTAFDVATGAAPKRQLARLQFISIVLLCCELVHESPGRPAAAREQGDVSLMATLCRLLAHHEDGGVPGRVLLLRMLLSRLKSAFVGSLPNLPPIWLTDIETNLLAIADNAQLGPTDIHRRTDTPGLRYRVGDRVQIADMEGPQGLGVITDWWPVRQALRVAGQPDHLQQAAAGAQPPYAGMSGLFVSEAQHVLEPAWYDVLIGDRVVSAKQSKIHKPNNQLELTAREQRIWEAKYQDWHQQHMQAFKYGWFEQGYTPAAAVTAAWCGAEASQSSEQSAAGLDEATAEKYVGGSGSDAASAGNKLHWQLQMGPYFEAWVSAEECGCADGQYVPNAYVRAKYPHDWGF